MNYDIIQAGEIQAMVQEWQKRAVSSLDDSYKLAIQECIHEMKELLNKTEEQREQEMEAEYKAYLDSLSEEEQKRLFEYLQEEEQLESPEYYLLGEA